MRNGGFNIDLSLARNGTLAYTTGGTLGSGRAAWVSREGLATPVDSGWDPQGIIGSQSLSPDGKQLAVTLTRDGRRDIWVKQLPSGPFSRITFSDTSSGRPPGRPTGATSCTSRTARAPVSDPLYARRADGTGSPRLVTAPWMSDRP